MQDILDSITNCLLLLNKQLNVVIAQNALLLAETAEDREEASSLLAEYLVEENSQS